MTAFVPRPADLAASLHELNPEWSSRPSVVHTFEWNGGVFSPEVVSEPQVRGDVGEDEEVFESVACAWRLPSDTRHRLLAASIGSALAPVDWVRISISTDGSTTNGFSGDPASAVSNLVLRTRIAFTARQAEIDPDWILRKNYSDTALFFHVHGEGVVLPSPELRPNLMGSTFLSDDAVFHARLARATALFAAESGDWLMGVSSGWLRVPLPTHPSRHEELEALASLRELKIGTPARRRR